jgi:hypothetical protein
MSIVKDVRDKYIRDVIEKVKQIKCDHLDIEDEMYETICMIDNEYTRGYIDALECVLNILEEYV